MRPTRSSAFASFCPCSFSRPASARSTGGRPTRPIDRAVSLGDDGAVDHRLAMKDAQQPAIGIGELAAAKGFAHVVEAELQDLGDLLGLKQLIEQDEIRIGA